MAQDRCEAREDGAAGPPGSPDHREASGSTSRCLRRQAANEASAASARRKASLGARRHR
eukprot:CAMPEP_0197905078 /NCGR_PEP_ID=MMETSP1439-20131203/59461_1 /TAXON_ID=66791 /ORGANISM="Gonyaulax spinifera, Strain CCMP409" /LENGTH=58 /DNA_ID=CAMNT_0043526331 /DNA_START=29 /DNA_END=201 /DNA_ORIENTATION=+